MVEGADHACRRVVGQDRAVDVVSDAVLRSRAGLAARNRGSSFLFLVRHAAMCCLVQQPGTDNAFKFRLVKFTLMCVNGSKPRQPA